jgi:hypothetical protein
LNGLSIDFLYGLPVRDPDGREWADQELALDGVFERVMKDGPLALTRARSSRSAVEFPADRAHDGAQGGRVCQIANRARVAFEPANCAGELGWHGS